MVIAMALLMVISMVIIYYEAVVSTIAAVQDHRLLDFGTICVGEHIYLPAQLSSEAFFGVQHTSQDKDGDASGIDKACLPSMTELTHFQCCNAGQG